MDLNERTLRPLVIGRPDMPMRFLSLLDHVDALAGAVHTATETLEVLRHERTGVRRQVDLARGSDPGRPVPSAEGRLDVPTETVDARRARHEKRLQEIEAATGERQEHCDALQGRLGTQRTLLVRCARHLGLGQPVGVLA
jgi:hypothetical protein